MAYSMKVYKDCISSDIHSIHSLLSCFIISTYTTTKTKYHLRSHEIC